MTDKSSKDIVGMLENVFKKAPPLPTNIKEMIVKYAPILVIVFGVLSLIMSISGLGLLTAFSPLAVIGGATAMSSYGAGFVGALIMIVAAVLMIIAYPGIKERKLKGWNMLFYSELVSIVGSLVSMSIISGLISAVIGFYILFQVKSYYK